jgi:hypothetical protein
MGIMKEKMHDFGWNEKESCKKPTVAMQPEGTPSTL